MLQRHNNPGDCGRTCLCRSKQECGCTVASNNHPAIADDAGLLGYPNSSMRMISLDPMYRIVYSHFCRLP